MKRGFALVVGILLVARLAASAQQPTARQAGANASLTTAADSTLEARTSALASQLRCPVCQGLSIQDSPSDLARSMRSLVRDQLAEGKSPDEVRAYFVARYGEWILLAPSARGFNLLAYAAPMIVIVGGAALIVVAVRRWTAKTEI